MWSTAPHVVADGHVHAGSKPCANTVYGSPEKTTLDTHDELLARAKRYAKETGRPLRAVVEDGLRHVIEAPAHRGYELPDLRVGDSDTPDPLATYSWPELRELIYGGSGT